MIYSMIGRPSSESQLQYHLSLSRNSARILGAFIKNLQLKHRELETRYDAAKMEASASANALRQKIVEFENLKVAYDQLQKQCELFRDDREIFAEAAEDAEERRAEADRRAAEAEKHALEAQQRERAALSCIENLLKAPDGARLQALCSSELKARLTAIKAIPHSDWTPNGALSSMNELLLPYSDIASPLRNKNYVSTLKEESQAADAFQTCKSTNPKKVVKVDSPAKSPPDTHCKDGKGTKRALFDASKTCDDFKSVPRQKVSKLQIHNLNEKENFQDFDADAMTKIEEAAQSDNETTRYLAKLIIVLKKNLVKAETEGDFLYAKYWDAHRLLMDTLEGFGMLSHNEEGVQLDASKE
ncbi:hypothetical protein KP509_21G017400 [Ceratopteris richardii]|nr:hypothetical protein KP509_21G017400 [Ceratopteris richardii]